MHLCGSGLFGRVILDLSWFSLQRWYRMREVEVEIKLVVIEGRGLEGQECREMVC